MMPSKGMEALVWLLLDDGAACRAVRIREGETVVGRCPTCDVVVDDPKVSGRHMLVTRRGTTVRFEDLGGRGGVRVNGRSCRSGELVAGDEVFVHHTRLTVATGPDAARSVARTTTAAPFLFDELRRARDPHRLLSSLLDGLGTATGAERGFVLIDDGRGTGLRAVAHRNVTALDALVAVSTTMCELALRQGTLVHVVDSSCDRRCSAALSLAEAGGPRTIVCAPLEVGGATLGVLYLDAAAATTRLPASCLPLVETAAGLTALLLAAGATRRRLVATAQQVRELRRLAGPDRRLVLGTGPADEQLHGLLTAAAARDVTVMITGETGAGKEVVARAIHQRSPRADGPFVAVDCGAIPHDMLEAEFFGVERGAFTGAGDPRPGHVEAAAGGTLFLDEVGQLSPEAQVKLLRVLQEHAVVRLGATYARDVDFRLLCATNADPERSVRDGVMRRDFYFRVNVFRVEVPPLRRRPDVVVPLATCFAERSARRLGISFRGFSPAAVAALEGHPWPGNVRELHNVVERCLVLAPHGYVEAHDLPFGAGAATPRPSSVPGTPWPPTHAAALEVFERAFFRRAVREAGGNVAAVVRATGMARATLYRKLRRFEPGFAD